MSVGTFVLLGWILLGFKQHLHEVFPALSASMLIYYLNARLDPAPSPQALGN